MVVTCSCVTTGTDTFAPLPLTAPEWSPKPSGRSECPSHTGAASTAVTCRTVVDQYQGPSGRAAPILWWGAMYWQPFATAGAAGTGAERHSPELPAGRLGDSETGVAGMLPLKVLESSPVTWLVPVAVVIQPAGSLTL
jgi:hypothetical protein